MQTPAPSAASFFGPPGVPPGDREGAARRLHGESRSGILADARKMNADLDIGTGEDGSWRCGRRSTCGIGPQAVRAKSSHAEHATMQEPDGTVAAQEIRNYCCRRRA